MIKKRLRELGDFFNPFAVLVTVGLSIVLFIDLLNAAVATKERFDYGTHLFALTSFVVAWFTANPIPFSDEIKSPGQRMVFLKTILSFALPLALAMVTATILDFFPV